MSQAKIDKDYADPDETLAGTWVEELNTIFLAKEQPPEVLLHTFFHEHQHYMEGVTSKMNEEDRCDLLGSYLMRLVGVQNLFTFLSANAAVAPVKEKKKKNKNDKD